MSRTVATMGLLIVTSLPAGAQDLADPGPFQVQKINISFNVPGAGSISSVLYYPTSGGGAVDPMLDAYPAIVFGHGYTQQIAQYDSTLNHLASHGYFVLGYAGQTGVFPDHQHYVNGLSTSFTYLEQINATSGGTFEGFIDTDAFGLAGHSLGGGISIVEAASDSRVKALMALCPTDTFTTPTAKNAVANVQVPIRLMVGTEDAFASLQNSTQPIYNSAQDPKQLMIIEGGGHGGYEDYTSVPDGTLPRAEHLELTRRELTNYFDLYLKGDESVWRQVWGPELPASEHISSVQLDPGMTLTPVTSSAAGTPGQTTTYEVTLTNTSRWASSFDLFVDDHSWATSLSTTTTAVVQPGQSTTFSITVTPTAGVFNAQDQVLLSARSGHDGHTRQFTYLTTSTGEGTEFLAASSENMALVTIDTAGNHWSYPGSSSGLLNPADVKFDADGNCFVADTATNRVVKFDSAGQSTILSNGSGIVFPTALAIDDVGNVYVSSHFNQKIIVIAPNGTSSVLADQTSGLTNPFGLTLDGAGNLYVASVEGQKVFKIDAQGIVSVFADTSDGLLAPIDVKIDAEGNIFVADVLQQKVFEFSVEGIGTIFADIDDGLGSPSGLMFDHAGNLFVSNYLFDTIVKLSPDGVGTVVATAADGIDGVFGLAETIQSLSSFANLALSTQAVPELGALPLCFTVVLVVGLRMKLRRERRAQKPV